MDGRYGRCKDVSDPSKVAHPYRSAALPGHHRASWPWLSYDACVPPSPATQVADEEIVPQIRPFRALRFDSSVVGDLADVVAPPYDVIDETRRSELVARHPANVVRLDLPAEEPGDEPDER
jgi:Protein of unknown function (DUF1015)